MKAMVLSQMGQVLENPELLQWMDMPDPVPGRGEILIRVRACGVCHTELDEIEGRTPPVALPMILGHQVVGTVIETGSGVTAFRKGERVGIAWIFSACGHCEFCRSEQENLCASFRATGRDAPGGYAERMTVSEHFAYRLPDNLTDYQAAPLLCAGAIGYRSLRLTGLQDGQILGLTGFGASAHLVLQLARYQFPHSRLFVFARNEEERTFARSLGATWAGDTIDTPPEPMHAVIDSTPAWTPIAESLKHLRPGGCLVINAIRKEKTDQNALSRIDYPAQLWMEKEVKSVANVTRRDVQEFLTMSSQIPIRPEVQVYPLREANRALAELKKGLIRGAKVLAVD